MPGVTRVSDEVPYAVKLSSTSSRPFLKVTESQNNTFLFLQLALHHTKAESISRTLSAEGNDWLL